MLFLLCACDIHLDAVVTHSSNIRMCRLSGLSRCSSAWITLAGHCAGVPLFSTSTLFNASNRCVDVHMKRPFFQQFASIHACDPAWRLRYVIRRLAFAMSRSCRLSHFIRRSSTVAVQSTHGTACVCVCVCPAVIGSMLHPAHAQKGLEEMFG